jgi:hypothetical protein
VPAIHGQLLIARMMMGRVDRVGRVLGATHIVLGLARHTEERGREDTGRAGALAVCELARGDGLDTGRRVLRYGWTPSPKASARTQAAPLFDRVDIGPS